MVRKFIFVCVILTQFARAAAFAAVAGVSCCANETSPACASSHVAKLVGEGLVAQLELLTKLASLACTITENKAPAPAKTPSAPVNHANNTVLGNIAQGSELRAQNGKTAQGSGLRAQNGDVTELSALSPRRCLEAPPGIERTPNRLFALARGGLDGASASIFSYGINKCPHVASIT